MSIRKVKYLISQGKYNAASEILDKLDDLEKNTTPERCLLELQILFQTNQYEDVSNSADLWLRMKEYSDNPTFIFNLLTYKLNSLAHLGKIKVATDVIQRYQGKLEEAIKNEIQDIHTADFLKAAAQIYYLRAEYERSKQLLKLVIDIHSNSGNEQELYRTQNSLSNIYLVNRENAKAESLLLKNLSYFEKHNKKYHTITLNNLSILYYNLGDFRRGLKYARTAYEGSKKLQDKYLLMNNANQVAINYNMLGELENAYTYYKISIDRAKELKDLVMVSLLLSNIGNCYQDLNKNLEASKYYQESLEISSKEDLIIHRAFTLVMYCRNQLQLDDLTTAERILLDLKKLDDQLQNQIVTLYYRFTKAIVLWKRNTLNDIADAKKILLDIIQNKVIDFQINIHALSILVKIQFFEFQVTNNKSVLNQLFQYLEFLISIAQKQSLIIIRLKALLVKFLIHIKLDEFHDAKVIISEIQEIVQESGNFVSSVFISQYEDMITPYIMSYKHKLDPRMSQEKRVYYKELESLLEFTNASFKLPLEIYKDDPILFLLISKTTQKSIRIDFQQNKDNNFNTYILEKFISELKEFYDDDHIDSGIIERFYFNNHIVLFRMVNNLIFCMFLKGKTFSAFHKLDIVIDLIQSDKDLFHSLQEGDFLNYSNKVKSVIGNFYYIPPLDDTELLENDFTLDNRFNLILHPIRYLIMKILYKYNKVPQASLRRILRLKSGSLNHYLKPLVEHNLISTFYEIYTGKPQKVLSIEIEGIKLYEDLREDLDDYI